jgi:hypothetical protein
MIKASNKFFLALGLLASTVYAVECEKRGCPDVGSVKTQCSFYNKLQVEVMQSISTNDYKASAI